MINYTQKLNNQSEVHKILFSLNSQQQQQSQSHIPLPIDLSQQYQSQQLLQLQQTHDKQQNIDYSQLISQESTQINLSNQDNSNNQQQKENVNINNNQKKCTSQYFPASSIKIPVPKNGKAATFYQNEKKSCKLQRKPIKQNKIFTKIPLIDKKIYIDVLERSEIDEVEQEELNNEVSNDEQNNDRIYNQFVKNLIDCAFGRFYKKEEGQKWLQNNLMDLKRKELESKKLQGIWKKKLIENGMYSGIKQEKIQQKKEIESKGDLSEKKNHQKI
ncbi:hypothetical protein PPERSA_05173 [Pseudocohnilembus persalinus]|uniref:Uncharacterized protein n=1 Tax=Pseudocohnilembus persalinus TaxID=266149 RepID=A0A0V0RA19_PSEPJ|nr:hypothetical protein PPERSA_05173 [Pseudocohnilembus persalinus]|eukprot:KRX11064.1 hypothetical protein PPERSA_05173 [Pseudocohnilembus persalinus]